MLGLLNGTSFVLYLTLGLPSAEERTRVGHIMTISPVDLSSARD
jgi:hypothetical protein